jgi:two-component system, NarL family, response regulator NreC
MDSQKTLRVLLADDHSIFRDGFKLLLKKIKQPSLTLVGEAENGQQLVHLSETQRPDLIFMDIQMPLMDGIEATRLIKKKNPQVLIMALSMFNQENLVLDMLQAGANGYVLKNTSRAEIQEAIRIITSGGVYFCPETLVHLTKTIRESTLYPSRSTPVKLSDREREVIWFICKGLTNKEIAAKLNLSIRTIESHREKILEKTGTKNSVEVAVYAMKHGVVDLQNL